MALKIYFGLPGSGKTTYAAKIVQKNIKKGIITLSNVPIIGAYQLDVIGDIGHYMISNCDMIIDEAGIEYNNRNYKSMPKCQIDWFKKYRHYHVYNIYLFSQSTDMDVTLRRLATEYWLCTKTIIPNVFKRKRIARDIDIDKITKQIIDSFEFVPLSGRFTWGRRYWKYFDSYEAPKLPVKEFVKY